MATKIDIFSGFLGAGKTTLIKKLIRESFQGQQVVLIENEFGEIGIDGGFLEESGIKINELNAGCICCSLVGDFREALRKVVDQYHPDRILIEPSGVGKLSDVTRAVEGVAETLPVALNSFVTVADVNKVKLYMKNFGEFYDDQVSHASCLILSRTGNAPQAKIDAAVALLQQKNPTATIVTTDWAALTGPQIVAVMDGKRDLVAELIEQAQAANAAHAGEEEHHHHHDHNHDHEFKPNQDGLIPEEELLARTNLLLEVDTYWVYAAGKDPVAFLQEHKDRIRVIHLKDGKGGDACASLGQGIAPVAQVRQAAIQLGLEMVVESEGLEPTGLEEVRRCMDFLRSQDQKDGN